MRFAAKQTFRCFAIKAELILLIFGCRNLKKTQLSNRIGIEWCF